jgi:hypothetical protein
MLRALAEALPWVRWGNLAVEKTVWLLRTECWNNIILWQSDRNVSSAGKMRPKSVLNDFEIHNSSFGKSASLLDSFLSRRFSDQGFWSTNSCFPNGNGNSALSKSVFFYILEEDGVDSSEFSASRGTLQNRPGSHFSTRGKNCMMESCSEIRQCQMNCFHLQQVYVFLLL